MVYAACGIKPGWLLPVQVDNGTNNTKLLKDPLYVGSRRERVRGEAYDRLLDETVQAIQAASPAVVPRRRTPDAAVPRPGDPYKAAATAPRRKTPEPAPRVVRTARVEAVVPPPRSKPRKSPAALPSLTCAPDTSFDLFAWPGEAPARDEDALLTSF